MKTTSEIDTNKVLKYVLLLILSIVVVMTAFDCFYIINAGERGILLTFGSPADMPSKEGLHLKVPIAQSVVVMDTKTQKYEASASAASKDLQVVSTNIAVNYHLTSETVPILYKTIGIDYQAKIIQPAVQEVVKASTAQFTAEELITKRELVKERIDIGLKERLLDKGIYMETTSITNFDFSPQFNQAIEQKVTAEQQALTQKNRLAQIEYEARQTVVTAQGQRDSTIAKAEGDAKTIELTAKAEAEKVRLIQEQLKQSPNYVNYIQASRWDGKLPQYMMGNSIPLFNMPMQNVQPSTQ